MKNKGESLMYENREKFTLNKMSEKLDEIMKQHTKGSIEFLFPPYTNLKQKIVDLTIKWF